MNKVIISLPAGVQPRIAGIYPTFLPKLLVHGGWEGFSYWNGRVWSGQRNSALNTKLYGIPGEYSAPDKHLHVVLEDAQETPWMGPEEKPNFPGVYWTELLHSDSQEVIFSGWSLWDGQQWHNTWDDFQMASKDKDRGLQCKRWKGLYDATKYEVKA